MTELRRNLITGEPVIFAPHRASRVPDAGCPFCPGNEHETPPELARTGDPWRVRVFDNKYPFAPRHEVIVESPRHEATFGGIENPAEAVAMYVERYRAMRGASYIALFKNHGAMAGASLAHMHSQLAGVAFIPPRIERELAAFAKSCPLCMWGGSSDPPRGGLENPPHIIDESEHFRRIAPHGSAFAYEQWIVPRRHATDFTTMTDDETNDLALRLRDAARSMERIAPSYNWLFMNFPGTRTGVSAPHWYVQAMPRTTTIAGFEIATGTFIDIVDPAAAAQRLRD